MVGKLTYRKSRLIWTKNMTYTIHEAKTHFSKLVREAMSGESVLIRRGAKGEVLLKLTQIQNSPFEERLQKFKSRKYYGKLKSNVSASKLVEPLPASMWEGW